MEALKAETEDDETLNMEIKPKTETIPDDKLEIIMKKLQLMEQKQNEPKAKRRATPRQLEILAEARAKKSEMTKLKKEAKAHAKKESKIQEKKIVKEEVENYLKDTQEDVIIENNVINVSSETESRSVYESDDINAIADDQTRQAILLRGAGRVNMDENIMDTPTIKLTNFAKKKKRR